MKKCPVCGAKNDDNALICEKCSTNLAIYDLKSEHDDRPFATLSRPHNIILQISMILFFLLAIGGLFLDLAKIVVPGESEIIIHTKFIFYDEWKHVINMNKFNGGGIETILYFAKVCIANLTVGISAIIILIFSIVGIISSIRVLTGNKEGCNSKNFIKVAVSWLSIIFAIFFCYYSKVVTDDKSFGFEAAIGTQIIFGAIIFIGSILAFGRIIGKNKQGDMLFNFFGFFGMIFLMFFFYMVPYLVSSSKTGLNSYNAFGYYQLIEMVVVTMSATKKIDIENLISTIVAVSFYTYMVSSSLQLFKQTFNLDDSEVSYKGAAWNSLISTISCCIAIIYVNTVVVDIAGKSFDYRLAFLIGIGFACAATFLFIFSNKEENRKKDFLEIDY